MVLPPYSPLLARVVFRQLILPAIVWSYLYVFARGVDPEGAWSGRARAPPWVSASVLYLLFNLAWTGMQRASKEKQCCGRLIPVIPKRSWLNIDVLREWLREGKTEYLGDGMIMRLSRRFPTTTRTFNTNILGERSIITFSPKQAHAILSVPLSPHVFQKGDKFRERASSLFGEGIFGSDGELWRMSRARLRPFFAKSAKERRGGETAVESLSGPGHVEQLLAALQPGGEAVDVQALFRQYTMGITLDTLFGLDSKDQTQSDIQAFARAFEEAQAVLSRRIRIGTFWSLFELTGDRMARPMHVIRAFVRPLVDGAMQARMDETAREKEYEIRKGKELARAKRKANGKKKEKVAVGEEKVPIMEEEEQKCEIRTLLDHLVCVMKDRCAIEDEVINILIAARDTTASALASCIYCLALYPQLQRELVHAIGNGEAESSKSPMLKAFIHEVLRLYPPVPLNIRRSVAYAELPPDQPDQEDLLFPANTSVILATLIIQRDPELWGDAAEQFLPSRWLGEDKRFAPPKGAAMGFQAFNLGPRTCLGQNFALDQITDTLVALFKALRSEDAHLKLSSQPGKMNVPVPEHWAKLPGRGSQEKCWIESDVVLSYKGGLWIQVEQETGI